MAPFHAYIRDQPETESGACPGSVRSAFTNPRPFSFNSRSQLGDQRHGLWAPISDAFQPLASKCTDLRGVSLRDECVPGVRSDAGPQFWGGRGWGLFNFQRYQERAVIKTPPNSAINRRKRTDQLPGKLLTEDSVN
jgi:hypothetical protein